MLLISSRNNIFSLVIFLSHIFSEPFATSEKGMSVIKGGNISTKCQAGHTTTFAVMMYLDNFDVRFQSFYS